MVKNPSVIIPTRPNLIPGILENSALTSEQSSNLVILFLFLYINHIKYVNIYINYISVIIINRFLN